jgi:hypothetical protein
MAAKVTGDAVGSVQSMFIADDGSSLATGQPSKDAGGKRFTAHPATSATMFAQDVNTWDDVVSYSWTIPNVTDIAAVGSTVTGKVGDTVKATIGIKNVGGASVTDLTPSDGTASWEYDFNVPEGTTVVSLPDNCFAEFTPQDNEDFNPRALGRPFYVCWDFDAVFAPGKTRTSEFGLKITQEISGATGTVSFKNPFRKTERKDDNAANNVAQVIVNPAAGGALLPVTGAQTAIVAGVGAVLLVAGTVMFRLARRRRVLLVTPGHDGT